MITRVLWQTSGNFAGPGGCRRTLVNEQKVLTNAQAAVQHLREAGIRFAITSGRPPRAWLCCSMTQTRYADAGFNGGLSSRRARHHRAEDTARRYRRQGNRADPRLRPDTWVYRGNDWLITKADAPHVAREAWTVQLKPTVVADVGEKLGQIAKIVGVSDDHDKVQRCEAEAQAAFGQRATANRSQPYYVDITHKDANKGAVVEFLSNFAGPRIAEIVTTGDQPNDVPMFKGSASDCDGQCLRSRSGASQRHDGLTTTKDLPRRWSALFWADEAEA